MEESQNLHWNSRIYIGIPGSTLKIYDSPWKPAIHVTIPGSTLPGILGFSLASQDPHWNPYWNSMIHTEISGCILKPHDAHCYSKIHTGISRSTLKYWDPRWNTWVHAEILASTLQSQAYFARSTLESWGKLWYPKLHTGPKGYPLEFHGSTLKTHNPHPNPRIHTGIEESKLESQEPHLNPRIHIGIPGSISKFYDPHYSTRTYTEILLESKDPRWNTRIHIESHRSTLNDAFEHVQFALQFLSLDWLHMQGIVRNQWWCTRAPGIN